jgi:hypothetical protein
MSKAKKDDRTILLYEPGWHPPELPRMVNRRELQQSLDAFCDMLKTDWMAGANLPVIPGLAGKNRNRKKWRSK